MDQKNFSAEFQEITHLDLLSLTENRTVCHRSCHGHGNFLEVASPNCCFIPSSLNATWADWSIFLAFDILCLQCLSMKYIKVSTDCDKRHSTPTIMPLSHYTIKSHSAAI